MGQFRLERGLETSVTSQNKGKQRQHHRGGIADAACGVADAAPLSDELICCLRQFLATRRCKGRRRCGLGCRRSRLLAWIAFFVYFSHHKSRTP
ncbi:hypothetical protein HanRHA438_Chr09g0402671 [Helianthus annuus]|nr:hypothetical protein HanRHA438_Chr09g0402671 [Helianthus annuus]